MLRIRKIVLIVTLLCPLTVLAEDGKAQKEFFLLRGLKWVKTLIDSSAVAKVDRDYIGQPKRPWSVELRSDANQATERMNAEWTNANGKPVEVSTKTTNGFSTSLGIWAGYRGYGLGYSRELTHGDGSTFSIGAMGGSFGLNFKISSYRSSQPDFTLGLDIDGSKEQINERIDLDDPVKVRSVFLDAYYMFNGRHFSYAAAYDQSLIQKHSAGSLMAGAMFYHTRVAFDDDSNWPLCYVLNDVGRVKLTQASLGAGYAYNWVPARGLLVSIMAMPMLTLYNRMQVYSYNFLRKSDGTNIYLLDKDEFIELDTGDVELREWKVENTNNKVTWNFDARLSVSYNWSRVYMRLYGHYNRFRYSNDDVNGRLTDWTAYAALGFRF